MVTFDWNPDKNEELKSERGVSLEEIALLLGSGALWKVEEHYNSERYLNQKIFFLPIKEYVYLVPCMEDDETIFLKTAFPSRRATRDYLKEMEEEK